MKNGIIILLLSFVLITGCAKTSKKGELMSNNFTVIKGGKAISYVNFIKQLAHYDVVFIGEKHDDPHAHYMELKIAKDLYSLDGNKFAISMEMFERDVQNILNNYLNEKLDEKTFLANSRPWSNYLTDYKPIIEFARKKHIYVIASNVPRYLANMVAMHGMGIYDSLKTKNPDYIAPHVDTLEPEYRDRFVKTMRMLGHMGKMDKMNVENFYYAQCIKDNTMAWSINNYFKKHPNTQILMINGSFHSDFGLGIPYRLKKMDRSIKTAIVKVESKGETIEKGQCDYLIEFK